MIGELEGSRVEKVLLAGALTSGLIHIYAGFSFSFHTLTLAGLGFLGGAALFAKDWYRNLVVLASIPYTVSQFYFYYRFYGFNFGAMAALDKVVQVVFVIAGVYFLRQRYHETNSGIQKFLLS